jgi:hypothetical protein
MKKPARRTPRSSLDERSLAAMLCPKAKEITHFLQEVAAAPGAQLSLNMRLIMGELAHELREIERHVENVRTGKWPVTVQSSKDKTVWERAVHRARLGVQETCIVALNLHALDSGWDPAVLVSLAKSLSSSQIASGTDWKQLHPSRPVRSEYNPTEVESRAQLAAIAMLHPSAAERKILYTAAQAAGWKKEKARNIVVNSDNGKLNDTAFLELRSVWYERFQKDMHEAQKRGRKIEISDFFRAPYSPLT